MTGCDPYWVGKSWQPLTRTTSFIPSLVKPYISILLFCPLLLPSVGSEYKIDASYLSPNVNLASRLEAATKQYDVPLLLSRAFVDCLSPAVKAKVSSGEDPSWTCVPAAHLSTCMLSGNISSIMRRE